jgi:hypothetical protein
MQINTNEQMEILFLFIVAGAEARSQNLYIHF